MNLSLRTLVDKNCRRKVFLPNELADGVANRSSVSYLCHKDGRCAVLAPAAFDWSPYLGFEARPGSKCCQHQIHLESVKYLQNRIHFLSPVTENLTLCCFYLILFLSDFINVKDKQSIKT